MIYDIAIIGAGTAGMTAALYALRANKTVLLLESTIYGGQIIQSPLVETTLVSLMYLAKILPLICISNFRL